jgi:large subunit ribosomal protein L24
MSSKIKRNDEVVVIAGNAKGTRAKVLEVKPESNRVLVEGVNKRKHHQKKTQENPEGSIVERENPIHISNVMLASRYTSKVENKVKPS